MSKNITIEVPSTITVGDYVRFGTLEHLSDAERIVRIVSVITNREEEEVRTWSIKDIGAIYTDLTNRVTNVEPTFLPIFEFDGITWGFQPIHKMTAGEFIDLESKLEGGMETLPEVLSILYRPITKNKLDGLKWKIMNNVKYVLGKSENLFKYYDIEEYDVSERELRVEQLKRLPIQVGLGAYSFFLSIGEILLKDIPTYFPQQMGMMSKEQMKMILQSLNTMDGSEHSTP